MQCICFLPKDQKPALASSNCSAGDVRVAQCLLCIFALQMLQKWVPNAPAVLYADKSPAYMQSWTPAKQKDLLQSMPASTAAEVILQLLLQSSHKWWYKALSRPQPRSSTTYITTHGYVESGLEIDAEDDATTITERPEDGLGDISDEEYDEEEVTWLTSSPVPVHVLTDSPSQLYRLS